MSSGGVWSLGGRNRVRRLLEKCGRDAGFWQAPEISGRRGLFALRRAVYDFGLWVLLLADSDERRAGGVHLFEFDRPGSRSHFLAASGIETTNGTADSVIAGDFGENKDSARDSVRRAASSGYSWPATGSAFGGTGTSGSGASDSPASGLVAIACSRSGCAYSAGIRF
jgi:hypothetical protein